MDSRPIISTSEGYIQGTTLKGVLGNEYLAFKGIPYAQPPLGPLRFKEPQPPLRWTGVRDASHDGGSIAIQQLTDTPVPHEIYGDEDCLYLNVYTKAIGYKRPVMFFIHGGSFVEGTGNDVIYSQDYLVTQDMLLVQVNYRLGPMGFLNLAHEVAPGNQALRDIIFALKWVQRNIESFGGDPDNVTIFGHSAGSMLCHLFTLIPMAKGLFHKAILQSGTIFMIKDIFRKSNFINGYRIASLLGLDCDDPVKIVEFLRTVPARKLIELQDSLITKRERVILSWDSYAPVFDADYTNNPVIPSPIFDLLKNDADIPIIIGQTSHEAILNFMGQFNDDTYKYFYDNIEEIVENQMLCEPSKFPEMIKCFREFYLKNKPVNRESIWNLIALLTDISARHFIRKLVDFRHEHARAPTYVYNFSYMGNEPTIYQYDQGPQPVQGVAHGDELSYIFYLAYMRQGKKVKQFPKEGTKDRLMVERLVKMWYNFAATGNPTPYVDGHVITTVWKPSLQHNLNYLDIGDSLTLKRDEDQESRPLYEKFKAYFYN